MRVTFVEYNEQTEELVRFMLDRLDEDDVLAGALRTPGLHRFAQLVGPLRETVNDYRHAVHRYAATSGVRRRFWERAARVHAWYLRFGARQYAARAGYERAWRRAPRPR